MMYREQLLSYNSFSSLWQQIKVGAADFKKITGFLSLVGHKVIKRNKFTYFVQHDCYSVMVLNQAAAFPNKTPQDLVLYIKDC